MKFRVFKKQNGIQKQIDDFLDQVSEAGMLFRNGIAAYLKGDIESFQQRLESISETERRGDGLSRKIEEQLYRQTLIPESRGDVLELLENMDRLLDRFKGSLWRFEAERPDIDAEFHDEFEELCRCVVESVESMVLACRAFFKEIDQVADHMHKVSFWEKECDKLSTRLEKAIFRRQDLTLCQKLQMRDLMRAVDKTSNRAEDVATRLSIYVLKRAL